MENASIVHAAENRIPKQANNVILGGPCYFSWPFGHASEYCWKCARFALAKCGPTPWNLRAIAPPSDVPARCIVHVEHRVFNAHPDHVVSDIGPHASNCGKTTYENGV